MQPTKILAIILIFAGILQSCELFLEPEPQNHYTENRFFKDPAFSEGVLLNCYATLPSSYSFDEAATDDAVSNQDGNNYRRMANGEWTSIFSPVSNWTTAYNSIYYANYFLSIADKVEWSWNSPLRNRLFRDKLKGEAYGMRAWYNFELLRRHAGKLSDGTLMGIVLLDTVLVKDSDWKLSRSSFDDCVKAIYADIDKGIALLPLDYKATSDIDSTRCLGTYNKNRISGRILMALKSRVALHVASQAFNPAQEKWEAAADISSALLKKVNGVAGLAANAKTFYLDPNSADIIWRRDYTSINQWERDNFPPSRNGSGRTNPTQNFVDAFPMANGYPITDALSSYQPNNPYAGRDPRLASFVIVNGSKINNTYTINTSAESATDGLNKTVTSTRTGYYLRKFMRENVNIMPGYNVTQQHFYALLRYTEVFLNYAEAANEAWGPTGDPRGNGFTAMSIIARIRQNAGITQPDNYLATVTTKEQMRNVIRNERRIELSFEGFRFWDLRRWNVNLNETAKGMSIAGTTYSIIDVEERNYEPSMVYGPIPNQEILKNNRLIQNAGW